MAVSLDPPKTSALWARRRGFTFPVLSDPGMTLMTDIYKIRSPFEPALPLHSTYIIGPGRRIIYRKNGGARPSARELLDALDYHAATAH